MSANIPEILDRLGSNLNLLCEKYALVREERDNVIAECEMLRRRMAELEAKLQQANTEIEYLKITHTLAPTADDVLRSRILITELVKKVDKCIAQLRND